MKVVEMYYCETTSFKNQGVLVDPNCVKEVIDVGSLDLITFPDLEYNEQNRCMLEGLLPDLIELEKQVKRTNDYNYYLDSIEKLIGSACMPANGIEKSRDELCYLETHEINGGSIKNLNDFKKFEMMVNNTVTCISDFIHWEIVTKNVVEIDIDVIKIIREQNSKGEKVYSVPIIKFDGDIVVDKYLLVTETCFFDFCFADIIDGKDFVNAD